MNATFLVVPFEVARLVRDLSGYEHFISGNPQNSSESVHANILAISYFGIDPYYDLADLFMSVNKSLSFHL